MIVTRSGEVLTNQHVIANALSIEVELANGRRYPARVLVATERLDLALLQIEGTAIDLPSVQLSTKPPQPGAWVMAMGQPFGLGDTVTVGVISGLKRDYDDLGRPEGLHAEGMWSFIQTDASINIGNSGGPLVDQYGEVVGITTAVRNDGQGLAFATPAAMLSAFLADAHRYGRVRFVRLGIKADHADFQTDDHHQTGVRITAIDPDGPAAQTDLRVGDIIVRVDGTRVSRVSDVAYLAQLSGVEHPLRLDIHRDGVAEALTVTLTPIEAT